MRAKARAQPIFSRSPAQPFPARPPPPAFAARFASRAILPACPPRYVAGPGTVGGGPRGTRQRERRPRGGSPSVHPAEEAGTARPRGPVASCATACRMGRAILGSGRIMRRRRHGRPAPGPRNEARAGAGGRRHGRRRDGRGGRRGRAISIFWSSGCYNSHGAAGEGNRRPWPAAGAGAEERLTARHGTAGDGSSLTTG